LTNSLIVFIINFGYLTFFMKSLTEDYNAAPRWQGIEPELQANILTFLESYPQFELTRLSLPNAAFYLMKIYENGQAPSEKKTALQYYSQVRQALHLPALVSGEERTPSGPLLKEIVSAFQEHSIQAPSDRLNLAELYQFIQEALTGAIMDRKQPRALALIDCLTRTRQEIDARTRELVSNLQHTNAQLSQRIKGVNREKDHAIERRDHVAGKVRVILGQLEESGHTKENLPLAPLSPTTGANGAKHEPKLRQNKGGADVVSFPIDFVIEPNTLKR
jgi:hypothetical protein